MSQVVLDNYGAKSSLRTKKRFLGPASKAKNKGAKIEF